MSEKNKNESWCNPSYSEDSEEWKPNWTFETRMPPLTERDIEKLAYQQRRDRDKKAYLIAEETLYKIYERNELAKKGYVDVQKAENVNTLNVDQLVKRILKGK
jgi:hypothetical protein